MSRGATSEQARPAVPERSARPGNGYSRREYATLLLELSLAGFRSKDQRTVLGFLWSLLNPLLMSAILYAVFRRPAPRGGDGAAYFLYVFAGTIVWNYFALATATAMTSLTRQPELVKNVAFPREAPVLSDVGLFTIQLVLECVALLAIASALGSAPGAAALLLPVAIAALALIATGFGLVLACLSVHARDLGHVWQSLVRVAFFATPVFYPVSAVPADFRWLVAWNPLTPIMELARGAVLPGAAPSWPRVAVILCGAALFCAAARVFFRARELALAERV